MRNLKFLIRRSRIVWLCTLCLVPLELVSWGQFETIAEAGLNQSASAEGSRTGGAAVPQAPQSGGLPAQEVLPPPQDALPAAGAAQEVPVEEPGYFGAITDDRQKLSGVRLVEVLAGGPAEVAGLRAGDLITMINQRPIREMADLTKIILDSHAGDVWTIRYQRGATLNTPGAEAELELKLGARPPQRARRYANFGRIEADAPEEAAAERPAGMLLGVRAAPLDLAGQRRLGVPVGQGAMILEVIPGSPAFLARIPHDAVIVSLNGLLIDSPDALTKEILQIGPGIEVELGYYLGRNLVKRRIVLGGQAPAGAQNFPLEGPFEQLTPEARLADEASARIRQLERQVQSLQERLDQLEKQLNNR